MRYKVSICMYTYICDPCSFTSLPLSSVGSGWHAICNTYLPIFIYDNIYVWVNGGTNTRLHSHHADGRVHEYNPGLQWHKLRNEWKQLDSIIFACIIILYLVMVPDALTVNASVSPSPPQSHPRLRDNTFVFTAFKRNQTKCRTRCVA